MPRQTTGETTRGTADSTVKEHWEVGDTFGLVMAALDSAGVSADELTAEALAPVDHFHARGFQATVELADTLPIRLDSHLLDLGCGLGGPARYFATRFGCRVSGIDLTPSFVSAARRFTEMLGLADRVTLHEGDVTALPWQDERFDGAYSQHVTMNIADRAGFFAGVQRVLRPGAFFAVTEHGRGPGGEPVHPVPWSKDGGGEYLTTPEATVSLLREAGFVDVDVTETGQDYLAAYRRIIDRAACGDLPPVGLHLLLGSDAPEKVRNSARNIEERRTRPVRVVCRKPARG